MEECSQLPRIALLLVGGTLMLMISYYPSVHQTSHRLLRDALGEVLRAAVRAGPGAAGGIGSVPESEDRGRGVGQ